MIRNRRALLALALLPLWPLAPAAAHPQYALTTINRYSKLALLPRGQLRLIYTLMVGDVPAFDLRRRADRDGDGRISQAEGAALGKEMLALAQAGLSLQIDGKPTPLRFSEPSLGLAGDGVTPAALSMDTSAMVAVPAGAVHEVRFEDRTASPPVGEVEILLEEGPGVRILESCQGPPRPAQPERVTSFRFYGPSPSSLSDRSVTVRFVEAQARAKDLAPGPKGAAVALSAALAVLFGAAFWARRWWNQRRMKG